MCEKKQISAGKKLMLGLRDVCRAACLEMAVVAGGGVGESGQGPLG
jgi:hypothetical protein